MFFKHIGYKFKILHSHDVCILDSSSCSLHYYFCFSGSISVLVTGVILFIAVKLRTKKKFSHRKRLVIFESIEIQLTQKCRAPEVRYRT